MKLGTLEAARLVHEVNRAYCTAIGDASQASWENTPDVIRESVLAGVQYALNNPTAQPGDSHAAWVEYKTAEGWTYGKTKDVAKKIHPALVEYSKLPKEQRVKDYLFLAVVNTLR